MGLPGTPTPLALAVLPFASLATDPDYDHFAEAFTGELALTMARVPGIRVAGRESTRLVKGRATDPRMIAAALDVAVVLDGSVSRSDTQVSIAAELVRAADGARLWTDRFDRALDDLSTIQRDVVDAVTRVLRVPAVVERPTIDRPHAEAYEWYLRGRAGSLLRRSSLERSLECFERAVAIDPRFPAAYAALSSTAVALGTQGFTPVNGLVPRARVAARKSIELDGHGPEARLSLATMAMLVDWDLATSDRELRDAAAIDPYASDVRRWQAWLHAFAGRTDASVEAADAAVALDPHSVTAHSTRALVLAVGRRPVQAIAAGQRATTVDPHSAVAHRGLAAAHLVSGDLDSARPELDQAVLLSRRHPWPVAELAVVCAGLGDLDAAERLHNELVQRSTQEYVQRFVLAQTAAALGRIEDAFRLLDQSVKLREPLPMIRLWPYLDAIRDHPRFRSIIEASRHHSRA